jgi:class 3 adenylate cyclase
MVGVERRLAAVLAADIVGYSRHMARDEEGTLHRLKAHLNELVRPRVSEHRGRIVKTTGDGVLVVFASLFDAFGCALDIQEGMRRRQREVQCADHMQFRIGINIGDIMYDEDDVYGDGVNIASRLEGLAEPGGICVSGRAWEDLRRLNVVFVDLGEQELKNIPMSVRAYKVQVNVEEANPYQFEQNILRKNAFQKTVESLSPPELVAFFGRMPGGWRNSILSAVLLIVGLILYIVLKLFTRIIGVVY